MHRRPAVAIPLTSAITALFCLLLFYLFLSYTNHAHEDELGRRIVYELKPSKARMPSRKSLEPNEIPWWTAKCSRFKCLVDEAECDEKTPTRLDPNVPPCCAHLLRDMLIIFDEVMQKHHLSYYVGFGTLLGLVRDDRIIPWTSDNDLLLNDTALTYILENENDIHMDFRDRGVSVFDESGGRLCLNSNYHHNFLEKYHFDPYYYGYYPKRYPYADLIPSYESNKSGKAMVQSFQCKFLKSQVYPLKRVRVYDDTFETYFPAKPQEWLRKVYGKDWQTPDDERQRSGATTCINKKLAKDAEGS